MAGSHAREADNRTDPAYVSVYTLHSLWRTLRSAVWGRGAARWFANRVTVLLILT